MDSNQIKAISLFSGAGGMDRGFLQAGIKTIIACEIDKDASKSLAVNFPNTLIVGDITTSISYMTRGCAKIVFGGPPCQGWSVAGRMNPLDPRSRHIWNFMDVIERVRPLVFVMENVDALATLSKWRGTLKDIIERSNNLGYGAIPVVLDAKKHGVPQSRKRMFLFGAKNVLDIKINEIVTSILTQCERPGGSVRDILSIFGPSDTHKNPNTCRARITYARNPVLRPTPYSGMLFNGAGRPLRLDAPFPTISASSGGNKTHFIDENEAFCGRPSFVEHYHASLMAGAPPLFGDAPNRLRRLTINECKASQTFPANHVILGSKSSIYRQIGNAVPCAMAYDVGIATKILLQKVNEI
jgi:DNA (cytosine-5)-methyltransferase 1